MSQKIIVNGRYIADLVNGTLVKRGRQVQKMYAMDGFGIPTSLLDEYEIDRVELHHENRVYEATIREVRKYGIPYHNPKYEPQIIVPVSRFRVRQAGQLRIV